MIVQVLSVLIALFCTEADILAVTGGKTRFKSEILLPEEAQQQACFRHNPSSDPCSWW